MQVFKQPAGGEAGSLLSTGNILHLFSLLLLIGLTAVLLVCAEVIRDWGTRELCLLTLPVMLVTLLLTAWSADRGIFSAAFLYLFIFSLFHSGLMLIYGLGLQLPTVSESYFHRWFPTYYGHYAILLVAVGTSAFGAGNFLSLLIVRREGKFTETASSEALRKKFTAVGVLLVLAAVGAWFLAVLSVGGVALLQSSYLDFLRATEHLGLGRVYFALGLGLVFLAAGQPGPWRRAGFAAFALLAAAGFPLGLRGEVLFPLGATLAVSGMRKPPISFWKAAILCLVLLSSISAIRQVRSVGVGQVRIEEVSLAPTEAIAEMGASIRPVFEAIRWHQQGDDFIYGESYWAPIDRALVYVLPGWSRPPVGEDNRLLNVLTQKRIGPIGFSVIAEAFRNFGIVGVALIMGGIGFLLGRISRWPADPARQAACGILLLPLLIQIRNAFTQIPMQVVTGLLLLLLVLLLSRVSNSPCRLMPLGDIQR